MQWKREWLTPRSQYLLACALVIGAGLYVFRWVLSPDMTFLADDWSWLYRSEFYNWTLWGVLPSQAYNDRPVGALVIVAFYRLFGLDYAPYGAMLLSLHIANGVLLSIWVSRILHSVFYGAIAGALFVINVNVAYQAWWLGTIFDSTCLFFCLCTFLAFLGRKKYSPVLTILFYFLAVRSKEASLPLPFLLFAYSFLENCTSAKASEIMKSLLRALKATWPVLLAFAVMFGIFVHQFLSVPREGYGPYAPKFDVQTVIDGIKIYLRFITLEHLSLDHSLVLYLALTAIAILTWTRMAILGSVGYLIAAAPVLLLASQRVPYYGYLPSPYIDLLLVALLQRLGRFLAARLSAVSDCVLKAGVLAATIWLTGHIYASGLTRNSLLPQMRENSHALRSIMTSLKHVDDNSKVVITGLPAALHLFIHAPCHAIMVIYKVPTIECYITGTDAELLAQYESLGEPRILLHYDQGNVSVVRRSPPL